MIIEYKIRGSSKERPSYFIKRKLTSVEIQEKSSATLENAMRYILYFITCPISWLLSYWNSPAMMLNKNKTINMTITPSIDPLMSGLLKAICAEMQMAINKNNQKEGFNKLPIVNKLFNNTNVDKSMFWIISILIEVEAIVFRELY